MKAIPSVEHERLVVWLDAIAILGGYCHRLRELAYGGRPDVLRVGPAGLFIADAKVSESAGDADCLGRLSGYLDATDGLGRRLLAIGTPSPTAARYWGESLRYLQPADRANVTEVSAGLSVAWLSVNR